MPTLFLCPHGHGAGLAGSTHCTVCGEALAATQQRSSAKWKIRLLIGAIVCAALGVGAYYMAVRWVGADFSAKPRAILGGHPGAVRAVVFEPSGRTVISGADGGMIRFWEVETGQDLGAIDSRQKSVYALALTPDGQTLASGGADGTIKIWDCASREERASLVAHESATVWSLAFAPAGDLLAAAYAGGIVIVWDVKAQEPRDTLRHSGPVLSVAYSSDGKMLASGSDGISLRLWNSGADKPKATLPGNPGGGYGVVHATAFAPNGGPVAWGTSVLTVKLNDPSDGTELHTLRGHTGNVFAVAFGPQGDQLASGSSDGTARLWDVKTGKELAVFKGHEGAVNAVAFSPDGRILACAAGDFYSPGAIKIWSLPQKSQ
jgi:WD40 repeat protein